MQSFLYLTFSRGKQNADKQFQFESEKKQSLKILQQKKMRQTLYLVKLQIILLKNIKIILIKILYFIIQMIFLVLFLIIY